MHGLDLCEELFHEVAEPILRRFSIAYCAGVIGPGSETLGYDDMVSRDHDWSARFMLFLREEDSALSSEIIEALRSELPQSYKGCTVFPVMSGIDGDDSVRLAACIWVGTAKAYLEQYIGVDPLGEIDCFRWLAIPEHHLLTTVSGRIFHDEIGFHKIREALSFYPDDVWYYLIAAQWHLISQEQAFMKRCGSRGDEIGSRLVCARIAERLMRLCFLYKRKYAPYSKWFGTGFIDLGEINVQEKIRLALAADELLDREGRLIDAQMQVALIHDASGITPPLNLVPVSYYDRDIKVLYVEKIAEKVCEKIVDSRLRDAPMIGTMSQIGGIVMLNDDISRADRIAALYEAV